jgi:hypothetical protein
MRKMKKLFILISLIFAVGALLAQGPASAVSGTVTGSCYGTTAANFTIPAPIGQEYDYSYQIIPALYGAGDSVQSAVALYQSNDYAGTSWTAVSSATASVTSTAGALIEGTNAKGLRHRLRITGVPADTVSITIYYVLKLDKQF